MALSITSRGTATSVGDPVTISAFTPNDASLLVLCVSCGPFDAATDISVSGGSLTWTKRAAYPASPGAFEVISQIWTAPVSTGASMTVEVTDVPGDAQRFSASVVDVTGYDTSTPIGITAGDNNGGRSGSYSLSLGGTTAADSAVFACGTVDNDITGPAAGDQLDDNLREHPGLGLCRPRISRRRTINGRLELIRYELHMVSRSHRGEGRRGWRRRFDRSRLRAPLLPAAASPLPRSLTNQENLWTDALKEMNRWAALANENGARLVGLMTEALSVERALQKRYEEEGRDGIGVVSFAAEPDDDTDERLTALARFDALLEELQAAIAMRRTIVSRHREVAQSLIGAGAGYLILKDEIIVGVAASRSAAMAEAGALRRPVS
jgi:hypothetical protein